MLEIFMNELFKKRYVFLTAALLSAYLIVSPALGQADNAVVVDPEHYKVEFENEKGRIIRARYGARERSVTHEHLAGIGIELTNGHFKITLADGTVVENKSNAGDVNWFDAGRHAAENLMKVPYEAVYIEIKD